MTDRARDPRLERTEAAVRAVVQRLLRDEGPRAITFGRISRESGVSRTTLYRHWASASELLAAEWARAIPAHHVEATGDLRSDLCAIYIAVRDAVESNVMQRSLPALLEAGHDDPAMARAHADFVQSRRQPILDRLEGARAAGELPVHAEPELLVDLLSGSVFYRTFLRGTHTPDHVVGELIDAVLAAAIEPFET